MGAEPASGARAATGATAGAAIGADTASGAIAAAGATAGANSGAYAAAGAGAGAWMLAEDTGSAGPLDPLSPTMPKEQDVPLLMYTLHVKSILLMLQ